MFASLFMIHDAILNNCFRIEILDNPNSGNTLTANET